MDSKVISAVLLLLLSALLFQVTKQFKEKFVDDVVAPPQQTENNEKIFTFSKNTCDPSCCNFENNATLSCSKGCICMTKDQESLLGSRGGNNTPKYKSEY